MPLLPSDGIRRVISTLAGGVLLPGGLGIKDPCEKDNTDAFASLSLQGNGFDFFSITRVVLRGKNYIYKDQFHSLKRPSDTSINMPFLAPSFQTQCKEGAR